MKRNDGLATKLCDVCEEEQRSEAQVYCAECDKYYCTGCDAFFHQRGKYKLHSRESISAPTKKPILDDDDDPTTSEQQQDSKKTKTPPPLRPSSKAPLALLLVLVRAWLLSPLVFSSL